MERNNISIQYAVDSKNIDIFRLLLKDGRVDIEYNDGFIVKKILASNNDNMIMIPSVMVYISVISLAIELLHSHLFLIRSLI
jgi:hypothetical protein